MQLQQFHALTGIRLVAAGWVVALHYAPGVPIAKAGHLGVVLFFVLSGFIISYTYGRAAVSYGAFILFRFARIWPVHIAVLFALLLATVLGVMQERSENNVSNFIYSALMIHAWGFSEELSWNYPSWSISAEWAAYLAFPAIWFAASRWPVVLGIFVCGVWFCLARNGTPEGIHWALAQIACQFTLGSSLYALRERGVGKNLPWSPVILVLLAIILYAVLYDMADPWILPLFALLILGLSYERGIWSRLFGAPAIVFLGHCSYSIYLLHLPVYHLTRGYGLAAALALTVVLSIVTYLFLEVPARRSLRRGFAGYPRKA